MADFSHQLYLSLKKYQYDEYTPINSDFFLQKNCFKLLFYSTPPPIHFSFQIKKIQTTTTNAIFTTTEINYLLNCVNQT